LHCQLDRYAYGPPQVRFTEADVDQARAAGVLIEFERGRPIIVDRSVHRELVKGAIKRTHDELQIKAAAAAQEKRTARSAKAPADPLTAAKRERDAQLRELTDQAHGANLDLGVALMNGLATVDPSDIDVARFFVLCGCRHGTNYADRLTMRISRCRMRVNGGAARRRREDTQRSRLFRAGPTPARLARPVPRGRGTADAGGSRTRRRSSPQGPRWRGGVVDPLAIADEGVASGGVSARLPFVLPRSAPLPGQAPAAASTQHRRSGSDRIGRVPDSCEAVLGYGLSARMSLISCSASRLLSWLSAPAW
jgi:hypothetical protein